jgi:hypothetical protein
MAGVKKTIVKTIGKEKHVFQVEGANLFEVMMEGQNLSFPDVEKCGLCGSDNLKLGAHTAKNKFKYVTIKCNSCYGSLNFGQQTEKPDIFYLVTKKDENGNPIKKNGAIQYDWKAYEKGQ